MICENNKSIEKFFASLICVFTCLKTASFCLFIVFLFYFFDNKANKNVFYFALLYSVLSIAIFILQYIFEKKLLNYYQSKIFNEFCFNKYLNSGGVLSEAIIESSQNLSNSTAVFKGSVLSAFVSPLITLFIIFIFISKTVALWLFAGIVIVALISGVFYRFILKSSGLYRRKEAEFAALFLDLLLGIREIILFGAYKTYLNRFKKAAKENTWQIMRLLKVNQSIIFILDSGFYAFVFLLAVFLGLYLKLEFAEFVPMLILAQTLSEPLDNIGKFFYLRASGKKAKKAINKFLDVNKKIDQAPSNSALPAVSDKIDNLTILPGSKIAFTGKSGSGKTTLLKYFAGFRDNNNRSIFQGFNKRNICYIPSKPNLLSGYLKDFGLPKDFYKSLNTDFDIDFGPEFYIEQSAKNISTGQKTIIAFLMGYFSENNILILDEITAGIDARRAQKIANMLQKTPKTVILATHNIDIFQNFKEIKI